MATRKTKAELAKEKEYAMERLRELLAPIDEIYTTVTWVNRIGDSHAIKPLIAVPNGPQNRYPGQYSIIDLSYYVSCIGLGRIKVGDGGVIRSGSGSDFAHDLVMHIAYAVFPEWECRGEWCGSNTHVNPPREEHRPGLMHTDGYRFHKVSI